MLRRQFLRLIGVAPAVAALPAAAKALNTDHLSAIDARLGAVTAGSPDIRSRMVIEVDGTMRIFASNGVQRVAIGRF